MRRIAGRVQQIEPTRAALFATIVALVAALVYFSAREAGIGLRSEAGVAAPQQQAENQAQRNDSELAEPNGGIDQQSEPTGSDQREPTAPPLTLSLSAPTICIVDRAHREVHGSRRDNDDGTSEEVYEFGHWTNVQTIPVSWRVGGGMPPYTLVIDNEPGDAAGAYEGASGGAMVSCALITGETYTSDREGSAERRHRTKPTIDSGLKKISVTVTDNAGVTATATIDVYAILTVNSSEVVLSRGKTYLVFGTLFSVPKGYDMRTSDVAEPEGGPPELFIEVYEDNVDAFVLLNLDTGEEIHRCVPKRGPDGSFCADPSADSQTQSLYTFLEEFSASRGREPPVDRP